jgi:hypothetical protein
MRKVDDRTERRVVVLLNHREFAVFERRIRKENVYMSQFVRRLIQKAIGLSGEQKTEPRASTLAG